MDQVNDSGRLFSFQNKQASKQANQTSSYSFLIFLVGLSSRGLKTISEFKAGESGPSGAGGGILLKFCLCVALKEGKVSS